MFFAGRGSSIPWKGQVFPRMRNYTPVNNMTGVGNALKRHYQVIPPDTPYRWSPALLRFVQGARAGTSSYHVAYITYLYAAYFVLLIGHYNSEHKVPCSTDDEVCWHAQHIESSALHVGE